MRHALSATLEPAAAVCGSLPGLVGDTPLVFIDTPFTGPGRGFWAKLEGHNPGGIKDRPALHMVTQARARGDLTPGAPIVESTSGTMGLGLALAGIAYGHPVTLVSDAEMEPMMRRLLRAYGAHLDVLSVADPVGGWQQARLDRVARHLHDNPGAWWPDQYRNPDNPAAYAGLAGELVHDLGRVDVLVCAVGTGGHSAGIAAALRRDNPGLRLIGVDATGSGIFGQPVRTRLMRGLGSSIHPANVDYGAFDEVHWIAPPEAVWAARALAAARYATGGWSTGAVALAAGWAARTEPPGTRIVAVFPDGPQRYTSTVFNDHYCRRHRLLASGPPADPDTLAHPGDAEAVRWTRCTTITDPATWAVPA